VKITRIDHIAIAVNDIDAALEFFSDTLGLEVGHTDVEEEQGVVVAFLPLGESELELIEPVVDQSGVAKWLSGRGPGLHHLCLEVSDLDAALARLHERGVQMIDDEAYIGAGGRRIAFIHPHAAYGVLVELYEEMPGEVRRNTSLDELRRRLRVSGRVAAAGTRGFLGGLRHRSQDALGEAAEVSTSNGGTARADSVAEPVTPEEGAEG
jgi:methylmalonyl-CoA/ethylmalonyl-CoA epimerase